MTGTARERLAQAQENRRGRVDSALESRINEVLDRIGLDEERTADLLSEADTVGPEARHKLRGILRHYAKMAHPFTACVRDNRKRFGPRVNAVCAVLKDIIRGTTKWRGHPALDHGAPGAIAAGQCPVIDDDVVVLLENVNRGALDELLAEVDSEVYGDALATLTPKKRKSLPAKSFVFAGQRRYPIHDLAHARNALARASGKPEEDTVKKAVYARYPELKPSSKKKAAV